MIPNEVIVIENPEDASRVAVIYPTGEVPIEEIIIRQVDTTKPYIIMNNRDLPNEDNDFFDAWQLIKENNIYKVKPNIRKARDIHRENLRVARKPYLEVLDIQFMRAIEQNNISEQNRITIQKQKLRDITIHPMIELANTCAELRKLTIDFLIPN